MCRICDGLSLDDVLEDDAARIAEHGFVLVGVEDPEGPEDHPPWAYTVGLLDAADHPEMIITGVPTELSGSLLSLLARSVLAGERYEVGETIGLGHGRGSARVGAVNEIQYELSTFNMWHQLHLHGAVRASELQAVQIILPSARFCSDHGVQPRLDDPAARVNVRRPRANRAQRRRHRPHRRAS
jgi:hypothetical protein